MTSTEERLAAVQARQEQYVALVHDLTGDSATENTAAFGDWLIRKYLRRERAEIEHELAEIERDLEDN